MVTESAKQARIGKIVKQIAEVIVLMNAYITGADRKVRVRRKHAEPMAEDPDPVIAAVARGVLQHIRDDARFHNTRAFTELSLELTAVAREALDEPSGLRPNFLGHLLVEVLLDASLITDDRARLEEYYRVIESVDGERIQAAVNRMAPRPTARLAPTISRFCRQRILSDYTEDGKLLFRLNQVMRRVGFARLPDHFPEVLPDARRRVDTRKRELLDGIPT